MARRTTRAPRRRRTPAPSPEPEVVEPEAVEPEVKVPTGGGLNRYLRTHPGRKEGY